MRETIKRALAAYLTFSLVLGLVPTAGVRFALADETDEPAGVEQPLDAGDGDDTNAPEEAADPAPDADPEGAADPAAGHAHAYVDGVCTECGQPLVWDIAYVADGQEDIDIYLANDDGTDTLLTGSRLNEIAIIATCLRLDDPTYRFDIGLSAASEWLPLGFTTNDVYQDTMAQYTSAYQTLRYTLRVNDNLEPQMFDVSGGGAEVILLSELDPATGTYTNLSPNGNPQFKMVFHLLPAESGEVPPEAQTVDSRAAGFTINLFDYATGDAPQSINDTSDLQFFEDADATTADSTAESNQVVEASVALQGIVEPELGDDGFPALTEFDGASLDVLFEPFETPAKDVYADVNHLFQLDDEGYYVYSSDDSYAYYDASQGDGGDFTVYDGTYNQARLTDLALIDSGIPIGFFPMDAYNDLMVLTSSAEDESLHHGLGMSVETSFKLSQSGRVDGEDLTFSYTGDDDAWLFVDDVLVLDAGGIHGKLSAEVNFATGEVTVGNASAISAADRTIGRGSTLEEVFSAAGRTWEPEGSHTLKFYSLERDGNQSDLTIKTNLWKVTDAELTDVTVTKQWVDADGNECEPAADSVTMELWQTVAGESSATGQTVTLSAENDWKGAFMSLPVFDEDGNRITYSVREQEVRGSFATYEVGGVTQQTKVYWVRYDASNGVEPGIYAVLSYLYDYSSGEETSQPVLLTSVGEDKEITYTDVFFVDGPVTDGATGKTYDQYLTPVNDREIWTFSKVEPETYDTVMQDSEGGYQMEDGYVVLRGNDGNTYYGDPSNGDVYTKGPDGTYTKLPEEGVTQSMYPIMVYETQDGYDVYYTLCNYYWRFLYQKDGLWYQKGEDGSYSLAQGTLYTNIYWQNGNERHDDRYYFEDGVLYVLYVNTARGTQNGPYATSAENSPINMTQLPQLKHQDGYVVLTTQSYMPGSAGTTYYTTDEFMNVYRQDLDGSYVLVAEGPVNSQYLTMPLYKTDENGYVVLIDEDGNTFYGDDATGKIYTKDSDGTYHEVTVLPVSLYPTPATTSVTSAEFDWQISNKGLNLTLAGPGQQWQDYTYITSTRNYQGSSNDTILPGSATFRDWNFRNVFRLDNFKDTERGYSGDGSVLSYDDAGLRVYSFQSLWTFTGLVTGYEKNLMAETSSYLTKETYMTQQAGSFWLYRPIYEEAPLDLADTDWCVVNHPAGDLAVSKAVEGPGASADDEFTFTIRLTGDEDLVNLVSGTFGDIDFVGGMATVTLKGGETQTATNLPAGLSYTVEETVLPGYELTASQNATGTIPEREGVTASFTNFKGVPPKEPVTPDTPVTPDVPAKPTTPARLTTPARPTATPATGDVLGMTWAGMLAAGVAVLGAGTVLRRRRG